MIKFGTSGWRALYHEDFTFPNVAAVIQAIAEEVKAGPHAGAGVAVAYDVRFMGVDFATLACEILAGNGIRAFLAERDVPTPALSHAIVDRKLAGGINFTASHNPFEYNGVKFSSETGAPALPETTRRIEARIAEIVTQPRVLRMAWKEAETKGLVARFDPQPAYFKSLTEKIRVASFAKLDGKKIAVDCKYSVARGYTDRFLTDNGVGVLAINNFPDPYFGHDHPEPAAGHVDALQECVRNGENIALGLANDGDADRFGIVDTDGSFVEANLVLAVLLDYLIQSRGWKGGIARSVATTHLLDRVAAFHGLKLHETPVGFKYIGELLTRGEIVFGGEESAGLTIAGHLPEKDGILACLLVAEMIAETGRSVSQLTEALFQKVGPVYDIRSAVRLTPDMSASFEQKMAHPPATVDGRTIERIDRTDGTKLLLQGGEWILLRKSGTEPVVRLYAEAASEDRLGRLLSACESWLRG